MSRLLPILAILIAIGLFFGYIYPTWTGPIAQEKQQIASYESALAAAATFTQRENQLLAEENAIPAASLSRLESYLPDGVNNVQLILDLNSLAQRTGITLSNFAVSDDGSASADTSAASTDTSTAPPSASPSTGSGLPSTSGTVGSITLSVSATGTYAAFRTFLAATEQSLRPMDVTTLTLTNSTTGVYTYAITYRIYWLQ